MPSKTFGNEIKPEVAPTHIRRPSALIINSDDQSKIGLLTSSNNINSGSTFSVTPLTDSLNFLSPTAPSSLVSPATQSNSPQQTPFHGSLTTSNINSAVSPSGIAPSFNSPSAKSAKAVLMDPSPDHKINLGDTASSISDKVEDSEEKTIPKVSSAIANSKKHNLHNKKSSYFNFQLPGMVNLLDEKKDVVEKPKPSFYEKAAISNFENIAPVKYFYNGDSLSFSAAEEKLKTLQNNDSSISSSLLAANNFVKAKRPLKMQDSTPRRENVSVFSLFNCFKRIGTLCQADSTSKNKVGHP